MRNSKNNEKNFAKQQTVAGIKDKRFHVWHMNICPFASYEV